jgi:enoyl reductase-like protein
MSGDWSLKFGYNAMPFDGILFGSRVMVAEENLASPGVKKLICESAGIENEKMWEQTYKQPTGNIITVNSELGEPIHNGKLE